MNFKLWFSAVLAVSGVSQLQAAQVIADRPGFSTGTHTVAPKQFTLEVGYQADMLRSTTQQTFPISNLRSGLTDTLEFNLMWGGYSELNGRTTEADLAVGLKQRLIDTAGYNLSALALMGLPTGESDKFSEVSVVGGLLWDKELDTAVTLFGVVQAESSYVARSRELDLQLALGSSFGHSDKLASYVELYTGVPMSYSGDSQTVLNGGVTYLLDSSFQIDAYVGRSVDGDKAEFIGFGIAKLF